MIEGQKNEWKRKKKKGVGGRDEAPRKKMRQRWFCLFGVRGYKAGTLQKRPPSSSTCRGPAGFDSDSRVII